MGLRTAGMYPSTKMKFSAADFVVGETQTEQYNNDDTIRTAVVSDVTYSYWQRSECQTLCRAK
jgi:translation elongation factor P/translation initiation factor 5A